MGYFQRRAWQLTPDIIRLVATLLIGIAVGILLGESRREWLETTTDSVHVGTSCNLAIAKAIAKACPQQSPRTTGTALVSVATGSPPSDAWAALQSAVKPFKVLRPGSRALNSALFKDRRPRASSRKFRSPVVDKVIEEVTSRMVDEDLAQLFANCFPNTLDTTVNHFDAEKPNTFIITGDINAQWLRDSTNQVLPYIPFAPAEPRLQKLVCGLIRRQSADVLVDPYANAFNLGAKGSDHRFSWQGDRRMPNMQPHVFEGKYELDSLAALLKLSYRYFNYTRDLACFDGVWVHAVSLALDTIVEQQKSTEEEGSNPPYWFKRNIKELPHNGRGAPAGRCGLSKCGFRPSDDPCKLPFLIPANAMAVVELRHVAEILGHLAVKEKTLWTPPRRKLEAVPFRGRDISQRVDVKALGTRAKRLAEELDAALKTIAPMTDVPDAPWSYEVNGMGSRNNMDDANLPSLLSLPYLGYMKRDDPRYLKIREFVWSRKNRWFFEGTVANGIGGPHIGQNMIWPMSIIMRGLTSTNDVEIRECLGWLKASSAKTGFLHESFHKGSATRFTRKWFAWVNTLFGELILSLVRERPHLLFHKWP